METFLEFITQYGIWIVFISAFFEGQAILLGAGILAASNLMDPLIIWIAGFSGAWIGHLCWFYVGRMLRVSSSGSSSRFFRKLNAYCRAIDRKPWTSVFFFQYIYGTRIAGAISFGISHLEVRWFSMAQLINCLIWAAFIESLGFSLGGSFFSNETFQLYAYNIWVVFSLIGLVFFFQRYRDIPTESD